MKHKRILSVVSMAILTIMFLASMPASSWAKDFVLEAEISRVTVATDKNGNEYIRMIVIEPKTLNGIEYKAEIVTTAFGAEKVQAAQEYKPGDMVKAIAKSSEYQGRTYYNVLHFLK